MKITKLPTSSPSRFVSVSKERGGHDFIMIKLNGSWVVRNPSTVDAVILELEPEIAKAIQS